MKFTQKYPIEIGLIIWLFWIIWHLPHPLNHMWGKMLVLFAPLVVVPLVLDVLEKYKLPLPPSFFVRLKYAQLPAALFFTLAYFLPQNIYAGLLSLPWLFFTAYVAWGGLNIVFSKNNLGHSSKLRPRLKYIGVASGMIYLFVGGVWATFDRFGIRPLDYDVEIVFLTVAHFHYAGFVLPIVANLSADKINRRLGEIMMYGVIAGVVLVAFGIICTHLGGSPKVETFAAWWLAAFAILLAVAHMYLAIQKKYNPSVTIFWVFAGVALLVGMLLAGLYGMRHIWAVPGLDIAWMRALHGSANVFGFSLLSILGWRAYYF